MNEIIAVIEPDIEITADITQEGCELVAGELDEYITIPHYRGENVVTPTTSTQILKTSGKIVNNEITVNPIPFYKTSNETGYTVIIG